MNEMRLIGLDGIGTLGNVDTTTIMKEQALEVLRRLPEGDTVELLKQLPESVVRKICQKGVESELQRFLPAALAGGVVAAGTILFTKSVLTGIGLGCLTVVGIVYLIKNSDETNTAR